MLKAPHTMMKVQHIMLKAPRITMKVQRIMMKAQHVKNIDHIRQSWISLHIAHMWLRSHYHNTIIAPMFIVRSNYNKPIHDSHSSCCGGREYLCF